MRHVLQGFKLSRISRMFWGNKSIILIHAKSSTVLSPPPSWSLAPLPPVWSGDSKIFTIFHAKQLNSPDSSLGTNQHAGPKESKKAYQGIFSGKDSSLPKRNSGANYLDSNMLPTHYMTVATNVVCSSCFFPIWSFSRGSRLIKQTRRAPDRRPQ